MTEYLWSPPTAAEARFTPGHKRVLIAFIEAPAAANDAIYGCV
jgi:hypothetical protein